MGSLSEITDAVSIIQKYHNKIILLKCSSAYPAISEEMNLMVMEDMKKRFGCTVGLSDHSMGAMGAIIAVSMGANVIEKHFCLSRNIDNPDSSFSMEPKEFASMVQDIHIVEKAKGNVFYGPTKQEAGNIIFRKSIFVVRDIKSGEMFSEDNIRVIRPGYGILPKYYNSLLGKRAVMDIKKGTPMDFSMVTDN